MSVPELVKLTASLVSVSEQSLYLDLFNSNVKTFFIWQDTAVKPCSLYKHDIMTAHINYFLPDGLRHLKVCIIYGTAAAAGSSVMDLFESCSYDLTFLVCQIL